VGTPNIPSRKGGGENRESQGETHINADNGPGRTVLKKIQNGAIIPSSSPRKEKGEMKK